MKKYVPAVLCLCLLVSLYACGSKQEPITMPTTTAAPSPSDTTAATEPTVPEATVDITALPQLSNAVITLTSEVERTEGDVLFEYSYPNVALELPDPAVSDRVMLELLNRIDETRIVADSILNNADGSVLNFFTIQYDPMRIDPNVLSLFGYQSTYAGGAHPNSELISVTYDQTTGDVLTLSDILLPGCTAAQLTPLVTDALDLISQEKHLYSDYTATVEERFGQGLDAQQGWYLSGEGLCVYFSPYEIAPYSTGEVIAVIPYEKLNGLLRDQFFPVEKSGGTGSVNAALYNESDSARFEQSYDVIIDGEGESVLLSTTGLVYDLILEYGMWSSDGAVFYPTATVFAASSLSYNEAVTVRLFIPDVMPNLRLTYTTDEGTTQKYIFQSGEDGSILLLDG